jgi:hypothetical protein
MASTTTLYRPAGLKEMQLILEADSKRFPPRRPEQPIFYPVLNFAYAEQIARDWNTKDPNSGFVGFVTEFDADRNYVNRFEVHTVGASAHQELWVPSEELEEFSQHIVGGIKLTAAYYGQGYKGIPHWVKEDWYADEIFISFYRLSYDSMQDFHGEMVMNRHAIMMNFQYWLEHETLDTDGQLRLLRLIAHIWKMKFPDVPLLGSDLLEKPGQ